MKQIFLLCTLALSLAADFHNQIYSDVCYTFVHNRRDLQPGGEKARQIRAEIVNRAYVTSKVVRWEREMSFDFPALPLIEDEVIIKACDDAMKLQKTSNPDNFVFYEAYQRALYIHTVDALIHLAKPKNKPQ